MNVKELYDAAYKYDRELKSDDERFKNTVTVINRGTVMHFENAFAIKVGQYTVVFSEHHRPVILDYDARVRMWGPPLEIPTAQTPAADVLLSLYATE